MSFRAVTAKRSKLETIQGSLLCRSYKYGEIEMSLTPPCGGSCLLIYNLHGHVKGP